MPATPILEFTLGGEDTWRVTHFSAVCQAFRFVAAAAAALRALPGVASSRLPAAVLPLEDNRQRCAQAQGQRG